MSTDNENTLTDDNDKVTVEFIIMPNSLLMKETARLSDTIKQVKQQIAKRLNVQADHIDLQIDDRELENESRVDEYHEDGQEVLRTQLFIRYRRVEKVPFEMPKSIAVQCDKGRGLEPVSVQVDIELPTHKKPFLGGYKHKNTLVEYYNAASQSTDVKKYKPSNKVFFHRDSQTKKVSSKSAQTSREYGTQMQRAGFHLDSSSDREVVAKTYFDSEQLSKVHTQMATRIQCFYRCVVSRRRTRHKNNQRAQELTNIAHERMQHEIEHEREKQKQVHRRMFPRSFKDFKQIENEMKEWHYHETIRIQDSDADECDKSAQLFLLMQKELKLLSTVGKLKIQASKLNRPATVERKLAVMAAPKLRTLSTGNTIAIETAQSERAKEIMELHTGLRIDGLPMDERFDVLLHVKWIVKEFDCALTREMVELIDRETDLLNRGRSPKSISGLRRRLVDLFFEFALTPAFNPEAHVFEHARAIVSS